jgi:hydrogenase maturation protease
MQSQSKLRRSEVVIAGFGSPHGDDQAGWKVIALLARRVNLPARLIKITEGTQLIDELEGCERLILVDACRGGTSIGATTRLAWPDPRVRQYHNHSTHGIGLCNALHLAERLYRLPSQVEIYGIEIGNSGPLEEFSPEVQQAVAALEGAIAAEVCEGAHA